MKREVMATFKGHAVKLVLDSEWEEEAEKVRTLVLAGVNPNNIKAVTNHNWNDKYTMHDIGTVPYLHNHK